MAFELRPSAMLSIETAELVGVLGCNNPNIDALTVLTMSDAWDDCQFRVIDIKRKCSLEASFYAPSDVREFHLGFGKVRSADELQPR